MAHDVFISYSSKDKNVADAVCATLEARKIRCWIAPRDATAGQPYAESILDGINNSRVFVLVFSSDANLSQQVLREVERAVSKGLPILPFRIEDVSPTKSMELFLSATHWLDALTPPLEAHLRELADTVQKLLGGSPEPPPESPGPERKPSKKSKTPLYIAISAVILVAVVLGILFGAGIFNGKNGGTEKTTAPPAVTTTPPSATTPPAASTSPAVKTTPPSGTTPPASPSAATPAVTTKPTTTASPLPLGGSKLSYGDIRLADIDPAGDMDVYSFDGHKGDTVFILATETGNEDSQQAWFNLEVEVLNPSGASIAKDNADFSARVVRMTVQLDTDGRYAITVTEPVGASFGPHTGPYTLALMNVASGAYTPIAYNEKLDGTIDPAGDVDVYSFTGKGGDAAFVLGNSDNLTLSMEVFDPAGNSLGAAKDWQMARLTVNLPSDGTYHIVVVEDDIGTGNYTLSLKNLAAAAAGTIRYGDIDNGEISPPGDTDVYSFTGNAGDPVILIATETGDQSSQQAWFEVQAEVFDPSGTSIAKGSAGFSSTVTRLTFSLPSSGRYLIIILEPAGTAFGPHSGTYTLTLKSAA